jgi:hypothetical protein
MPPSVAYITLPNGFTHAMKKRRFHRAPRLFPDTCCTKGTKTEQVERMLASTAHASIIARSGPYKNTGEQNARGRPIYSGFTMRF